VSRKEIPLSKISPPLRTGHLIGRPRLFRKMDAAFERPVLWVSGPAGSGKTSLAASYIEARGLPFIWYRVDPSDDDPATFFYYLTHAARKATPGKRRPLPRLTPEYMGGLDAFTMRYFDDLFRRLDTPFLIVLDDYHEVPENSRLHGIISHAAGETPPGFCLIILSRTGPPPEMARTMASRLMSHIGPEHLKFDMEEIREVIRMGGVSDPDDSLASVLYERTDGWAAGIVLLLDRDIDELERNAGPPGVSQEVFDYLAEEVFKRLDHETRDFLAVSAILPVMTPRSAEALTGCPCAGELLDELCERNYFTERIAGMSPAYRFHPLFREFLLEHGRRRMEPERRRKLELHAAEIMVNEGHLDDAVAVFARLDAWRPLGRLIHENAARLLSEGRNSTLVSWAGTVPEDVRDADPMLHYWLGMAFYPYDQRKCRGLLERAYERLSVTGPGDCAYLAWAGIVESILAEFHDFSEVDRWLPLLDDLEKRFGGPSTEEVRLQVACAMFSALVRRHPDHPDIIKWKDEAVSLARESTDMTLRLRVLFQELLYLQFFGDEAAAEAAVTELEAVAQRAGMPPLIRLFALVGRSQQSLFSGEHTAALDAARKGLAIAERSGVHLLDHILAGNAALAAMAHDRLEEAGEFLDRMERSLDPWRRWDFSFYHYIRAFYEAGMGNLDAAAAHSVTAWKSGRQAGAFTSDLFLSIQRLLIECLRGDFESAEEFRRYMNELAARAGGTRWRFMSRLLEAYLSMAGGNDRDTAELLDMAMSFGRKNAHYGVGYSFIRPFFADLCAIALENDIEPDYVKKLIARNHIIPRDGHLHIESWPWAVRVYTLGRFSVEVDGEPLAFSGRAQKKPLELLQALIALGRENVYTGRLADALWPEADGDLAERSLKTNLSRLRRLLRRGDAVITRAGRISLSPYLVWTDAGAFERAAARCIRGEEGKAEGPPAPDLLDVYGGGFLPGCEEPWAVAERERLRGLYLEALMSLGARFEAAGDDEAAAGCYRRGLKEDPLVEGLYQRLIACYGRMGRGAEAVRTYERCREALASGLGTEPSERTAEILKRFVPSAVI